MALSDIICEECGKIEEWGYIHSKCHPSVPTWVRVNKDDVIEILCAECNKLITSFTIKRAKN